MYTTLTLIGITLIFTILIIIGRINNNYGMETLSWIVGSINTLILIGCIINISNKDSIIYSDINDFESIRSSIYEERKDSITSYERVAITTKIIEKNEWLAHEQYWAKNKWMN